MSDSAEIDVLLVEDDEGDVLMTREAFEHHKLRNQLHVVPDGVEAISFLRREGKHEGAPRPGLILLDLNLPRKDGREVLEEIKSDETLRSIPVVVLTTSQAEEDIARTYDLGVNSFITKPVTFDGLVQAMDAFSRYWLEIVELPNGLAA